MKGWKKRFLMHSRKLGACFFLLSRKADRLDPGRGWVCAWAELRGLIYSSVQEFTFCFGDYGRPQKAATPPCSEYLMM